MGESLPYCRNCGVWKHKIICIGTATGKHDWTTEPEQKDWMAELSGESSIEQVGELRRYVDEKNLALRTHLHTLSSDIADLQRRMKELEERSKQLILGAEPLEVKLGPPGHDLDEATRDIDFSAAVHEPVSPFKSLDEHFGPLRFLDETLADLRVGQATTMRFRGCQFYVKRVE